MSYNFYEGDDALSWIMFVAFWLLVLAVIVIYEWIQ